MPTLRPHQQKTLETAENKQGLWFRMRVGKTPTAIRLACSRATSALVICPKSLQTQWKREIETWDNSQGECGFTVLSKENFKKHAKQLPIFDAIIIDECHLGFANTKNQMFKALMHYIKRVDPKHIWLLTGTPYTSTSWSIYAYGKILGRDWKWNKWSERFFDKIRMGNRWIPQARTDRDEELQDIIRSLGIVIDLKDVADVPDDEEVIETFTLSAEQKKIIKECFDPLPIVRFTRQHQLEQGVLKSDGYKDTLSFTCAKDRRIKEIVEQNEKIIIVCRYHDQIRKITKLLEPLGRNIYHIHGQCKELAGDVAQDAENDPTAIVIAQGDTCAGYSLKSFNVMLFASMSYSFVNYDQMCSRMKAMEKTTGCTYIHMMTEGKSVDKGVYDAVKNKQDFSVELFKKEK